MRLTKPMAMPTMGRITDHKMSELDEMARIVNVIASAVEAIKGLDDAFDGMSIQLNVFAVQAFWFEIRLRANLCAWIYQRIPSLGLAKRIAREVPRRLLFRLPSAMICG